MKDFLEFTLKELEALPKKLATQPPEDEYETALNKFGLTELDKIINSIKASLTADENKLIADCDIIKDNISDFINTLKLEHRDLMRKQQQAASMFSRLVNKFQSKKPPSILTEIITSYKLIKEKHENIKSQLYIEKATIVVAKDRATLQQQIAALEEEKNVLSREKEALVQVSNALALREQSLVLREKDSEQNQAIIDLFKRIENQLEPELKQKFLSASQITTTVQSTNETKKLKLEFRFDAPNETAKITSQNFPALPALPGPATTSLILKDKFLPKAIDTNKHLHDNPYESGKTLYGFCQSEFHTYVLAHFIRYYFQLQGTEKIDALQEKPCKHKEDYKSEKMNMEQKQIKIADLVLAIIFSFYIEPDKTWKEFQEELSQPEESVCQASSESHPTKIINTNPIFLLHLLSTKANLRIAKKMPKIAKLTPESTELSTKIPNQNIELPFRQIGKQGMFFFGRLLDHKLYGPFFKTLYDGKSYDPNAEVINSHKKIIKGIEDSIKKEYSIG